MNREVKSHRTACVVFIIVLLCCVAFLVGQREWYAMISMILGGALATCAWGNAGVADDIEYKAEIDRLTTEHRTEIERLHNLFTPTQE